MNLAFIAMEGVLLVLLFKKLRAFPRAMIAYFFIVFVLVASDYFLAKSIPAIARLNDAESRGTFIRSGLLCAIWVPYFIRSKRVRGTFTQ